MPLNYTNSIPLHVQLTKEIKDKILNGVYVDKVPSERELMDEYYVSRSTVRQSIEQLVREGLLIRKPGKGTFISFKPINEWLGSLSTTAEVIQKMGMEPGTQLIEAKVVTLNNKMKSITGLKKAYYIKRLRFANQIPVGIERHYFPVALGEELAKFDLNNEAIYDLLENELDVTAFESQQIIKAGLSTEKDAELLKIPPNSSILIAERKIVDIEGNFIEYEDAYYRSDMYAFNIRLSRER